MSRVSGSERYGDGLEVLEILKRGVRTGGLLNEAYDMKSDRNGHGEGVLHAMIHF